MRPGAENSNVAVELSVGSAGFSVIVTAGASPPTSHVNSAGVSSTLPLWTARTANTCSPKTMSLIVTPAGLLRTVPSSSHGTKVSSSTASSSAHWKVAPALSDVYRKVASSSFVDVGGSGRTKFVSGRDSIVHVCSAGVGSTPLAAFRARTFSVCVPGVRLPSWYGVSQPVYEGVVERALEGGRREVGRELEVRDEVDGAALRAVDDRRVGRVDRPGVAVGRPVDGAVAALRADVEGVLADAEALSRYGVSQEPQIALSSEHSNSANGSLELNVKLAFGLSVESGGLAAIVVLGASTVHV